MPAQVYTAINHTLASVFPVVTPFLQHLPSFADCWVSFAILLSQLAE